MFSIGQTIKIQQLPIQNEINSDNIFYSKVVSVNDTSFYIEQPTNKRTRKTTFFFEQTSFLMTITTKYGEVYQYETLSIKNIKETMPIIQCQIPKSYERIQRRSFARINVLTEVTLKLKKPILATTIDLSGGGVKVYIRKNIPIAINDAIEISLLIESVHKEKILIDTVATVVRYEDINEETKERAISFKFTDILESDRSKIIQYCFRKELEQKRLQKGEHT